MAKDLPVSPLAPASFADLPPVKGIALSARAVGLRYQGRKDVLVGVFAKGTTVAGVTTTSKCPSAAVEACRESLVSAGGFARGLVVNAGNSNAFTGKLGLAAVEAIVSTAAKAIGCEPIEIFTASTGVIGEPLKTDAFLPAITQMVQEAMEGDFTGASEAILTTDTFPKRGFRQVEIDGQTVTLCGIAKGSGMIAPDMATMLSFLFTDAPIAAPVLQSLLSAENNRTFNAITVDGDTSTSDTALLFASGALKETGMAEITSLDDPRLPAFRDALYDLLKELAQMIVRDGEGATKFVTVTVDGAVDDASAKRIALSIANSPLVKTAIAGQDANWGRVVMAVGKAGEPADRDKLAIYFGGVKIADNGQRVADYREEQTSAHMQQDEIDIRVDIGLGQGKAVVWTCDLTHGYISINGDYRS